MFLVKYDHPNKPAYVGPNVDSGLTTGLQRHNAFRFSDQDEAKAFAKHLTGYWSTLLGEYPIIVEPL